MTTKELKAEIAHLEKHIKAGEQFEEESDLIYEMNMVNRALLAKLKAELREKEEERG